MGRAGFVGKIKSSVLSVMSVMSIRHPNGDVKETGEYASQSSRTWSKLKTYIWEPLTRDGSKT